MGPPARAPLRTFTETQILTDVFNNQRFSIRDICFYSAALASFIACKAHLGLGSAASLHIPHTPPSLCPSLPCVYQPFKRRKG